jgi:hypothetical protein
VRVLITRRLIEEKGFGAVAVEADWPDAYRVNRYVRGAPEDADAEEALRGFCRFPGAVALWGLIRPIRVLRRQWDPRSASLENCTALRRAGRTGRCKCGARGWAGVKDPIPRSGARGLAGAGLTPTSGHFPRESDRRTPRPRRAARRAEPR